MFVFVIYRVAYWLQLVHPWALVQILVDPFVCLVSLMEYLVTSPPKVRKLDLQSYAAAISDLSTRTRTSSVCLFFRVIHASHCKINCAHSFRLTMVLGHPLKID